MIAEAEQLRQEVLLCFETNETKLRRPGAGRFCHCWLRKDNPAWQSVRAVSCCIGDPLHAAAFTCS